MFIFCTFIRFPSTLAHELQPCPIFGTHITGKSNCWPIQERELTRTKAVGTLSLGSWRRTSWVWQYSSHSTQWNCLPKPQSNYRWVQTSPHWTRNPFFTDIYTPHQKNHESFIKTEFNNRGKDLGGLIWEENPVKHRLVAKKVAPAFSNRSLRSMEPLIHTYMDFFILKMSEIGAASEGVGLVKWTTWLSMDLAADLSWNEKMNQMRDRTFLNAKLIGNEALWLIFVQRKTQSTSTWCSASTHSQP